MKKNMKKENSYIGDKVLKEVFKWHIYDFVAS